MAESSDRDKAELMAERQPVENPVVQAEMLSESESDSDNNSLSSSENDDCSHCQNYSPVSFSSSEEDGEDEVLFPKHEKVQVVCVMCCRRRMRRRMMRRRMMRMRRRMLMMMINDDDDNDDDGDYD